MPLKVDLTDAGYFAVTVEPGTKKELRVHGHLTDEGAILNPARLGMYVRHLRESPNERRSIKKVCDAIDVSTGYLWRIEAGEVKSTPGAAIIRKLADYYGVGVDSLMALSGARSVAEMHAEQDERESDSVQVQFTRLVLHDQLRPAGLAEDDLGWVPAKLQHAWVDFAHRLAQAVSNDPDALQKLLDGSSS
jgi:transcriptional regulator with XRE-family HTH domain